MIHAKDGEEACATARQHFKDYEYLSTPTATITAEEITMKYRADDIANKEEWAREADEEAWAAEAAAATARRQKSNGKGA